MKRIFSVLFALFMVLGCATLGSVFLIKEDNSTIYNFNQEQKVSSQSTTTLYSNSNWSPSWVRLDTFFVSGQTYTLSISFSGAWGGNLSNASIVLDAIKIGKDDVDWTDRKVWTEIPLANLTNGRTSTASFVATNTERTQCNRILLWYAQNSGSPDDSGAHLSITITRTDPPMPSRPRFYAYGNGGTTSLVRPQQIYSINLTNYSYGFSVNSNGYFESQNKGVDSSYAMMKIQFSANAGASFTIKYISYGESNYDYAIFSNLDSALSESNTADSSYYKRTYGESSPNEKSITYSNITGGSHFIYVKYRKDKSVNNGSDTLQIFFESDAQVGGDSVQRWQYIGLMYGTLPIATRTGYTFGGWWTAASGGTQITSTSIFNGSNIYAHWLVNVSFDSENIYDDYGWSCAGENVSVNFSKGFDDNGQVFTYCYINSFNSNNDGGPYFYKERLIVGETYIWRVDLKSTRAHDLYNVGHEQGGLISVSVNTNWKSFTHEFVATDREYNAFVIYGGYTAGETLSVANLTIQKKSDVSFDTAVYNLKKSPNKAYGHLPTPERSGWTFDGWFDSSISGVGNRITETSICRTNSHTLYAHWSKSFSLFLDANGGTPTTQHTVYYDSPNCQIISSNYLPSRIGYTFNGFTNSSSGGTYVYDANGRYTGNYVSAWGNYLFNSSGYLSFNGTNGQTIFVYAQWTPNTYSITFDGNGGEIAGNGYRMDAEKTYSGSNYDNLGRTYMYTDKLYLSIEAYMSNWSDYAANNQRIISCTEGGGWNIESVQTHNNIEFAIYDYGVDYRSIVTDKTWSSLSSGWHKFELSFDGQYAMCWVDGVFLKSSAKFSSGKIGYNTSNSIFVGAEAGSSSTSPYGSYFVGKIRNIKILNTFKGKCVDFAGTYGTLSTATRNNYSFAGWWTSASGGTQVTSSSTNLTAGNQILYAHWTPNAVTHSVNLRVISPDGKSVTETTLGGTVRVEGYQISGMSSSFKELTRSQTLISASYSVHSGQQFKLTATPNQGYVFAGFSTSSSASASNKMPSASLSKTATYTPTSGTSYYVYFKQVSPNQLKYDETDKYFYFEDGYYPQSEALDELEKMNFSTNNGQGTAVSNNGRLTINGAGGYGVVFNWNRSFKEGQQFLISVNRVSGSVSGNGCFAFEVYNSSNNSVSTRNYYDVRFDDQGGIFTINAAGGSEGVKLVLWIYNASELTFNNAVFDISVKYILENDLNNSATANGEKFTYNDGSQNVDIPVYTYNNEKYVKVTKGSESKWFKFESIRWRISDYGVEKTETNYIKYEALRQYTGYMQNFTAVSDLILGVGAMHNSRSVSEGTSVTSMKGFQLVQETTDGCSITFQYAKSGNVIKVDNYSTSSQNNAVSTGTTAYSAPLRIASLEEITSLGLVNKGARASDMVAFILGVDKNQVTYWTRDLSNLGSGVAITSTGTKVQTWLNQLQGIRFAYTFSEGMNAGRGSLEYDTINYIQSTGTQYIDTGVTDIEGITCEFKASWQSYGKVVGQCELEAPYGRNSAYLTSMNNWMLDYGDFNPTFGSAAQNNDYLVKYCTNIGNAYIDVDGNRLGESRNETTLSPSNLWIFTTKYDLNLNSLTEAKLYSCKIWGHQGNLLRNFIPVRNVYTGEVGLLDKVSGQFFGNSGTGNFVAG